ncbi:MAG: lipoyl(octanoyl) transferase LipB, partial [Alphaproteobacteria bacterium]|nr:lipoyl(octanoyl) transferase LipB [Alphaproteobacteria bacterium]
ADECIFFTEHEALYSAGKSFEKTDFLKTPQLPVYYPNRGGRVTVHSPGQVVIYPIINLKKRNLNIHEYVVILENWMIAVLKDFGISGQTSDKGVGVWVKDPQHGDAKIGFIGIHVTHGVTSHGLCFNVCNDLSLFNSILPCGLLNNSLITTSSKLGIVESMQCVASSFKCHIPFSSL